MIIDTHAHFYPGLYLDLVEAQGADNNDTPVPAGTFGDIYRDLIFEEARGSSDPITATGLDLTTTGLALNTGHVLSIWGYDSLSTVQSNWMQSRGTSFALDESGDGDLIGSTDPNANLLTDALLTFRVTTDNTGRLLIEGRASSSSFRSSDHPHP